MATILNIETSTKTCSVALSVNGQIISQRVNSQGQNHGKLLGVFVNEVLLESNIKPKDLDAVALSCGPGSYTGLRIGTSYAKGLCYGADIKLISIPTLKIIAKGRLNKGDIQDNELLCPMIDARRLEVYTEFYNNKLELIRPTHADIIDENSYSDLLESNKIHFFGDGASKCSPIITSSNAIFDDHYEALAENMVELAEQKFKNNEFEDIAYFEPFYLKEFVATTPKNKVF